jgi:hypothetical protein
MADRSDWERERERTGRWDWDWDRNREERNWQDFEREREPGRGPWDRERDWSTEGRHDRGWTRSEWERPEYGRGREDWMHADWRYPESWGRGEYRYRGAAPRAGEYGGPGDYGNQGIWGTQGNRQDWSRGNEWQWNWNPRGRPDYPGSSSYYGGMGSFGGGMTQYGERGRFAGRGPRGWQRSDERIRDDINERLTDHPALDATEIQVQVNQGEVTLGGTVDERRAKRLAEDIAESVSGVKDVHNQLRVQQHAAAQSQSHETPGRR